MSGRVRITLADGRRVTGYRKTLRQRRESVPTDKLPDWVLRYQLPDELAFSVSTGPTGVMGVTVVIPGPTVEARGKNKDWVEQQASAFLTRIAAGLIQGVDGVLTRDPYPGVTDGAPWRPKVRRVVRVEVKR
jgi:hypothetical protein